METPVDTSTTRKSDRISISIGVKISWTTPSGKPFTEHVQTVNISRNGCCLLLKRPLLAEQRIHLQRAGSGEEAIGRVVGQTGIRPEGNLYGVEILNVSENFWGIRFPPQKQLEEATVRVLLKCSECQTCEEAALNEVELPVFQVTHRLTRKCQRCGDNTVWETVADATSPAGGPETPGVPSKPSDKRKHPRISMRTLGCVGPAGPNADVVDVINVSRGGVCFRSSRTYLLDSWIQIAVPYTPGAANIFVAGRIAHSRRVDNTSKEYGVAYVRT